MKNAAEGGRQKMSDICSAALDFPILTTKVYGKPLVYFDNAATTQVPRIVLDTITEHYKTQNANVHRGTHYLSERSTMCMENARKTIQKFINAESAEQIVFTSGTTDSLNTVARSYLQYHLEAGDQVMVSEFEHHSNFVVWQQLCMEKRADFIVIPEKNGTLDMEYFLSALGRRTKFVSMALVSNVTGVRLPVEPVIRYAHEAGAVVCVDGAQGIRHGIDAAGMGCDFLCFSGHKMMGSAGTGVLYTAGHLLDQMRPAVFGGGMVDIVTRAQTTFAKMPYRLEAGTPNYPGIIGLGAAAEYLTGLGITEIAKQEKRITEELGHMLDSMEGITVLGGNKEKHSVVSVVIDNVHPYDAACLLDKYGIAVRSGSHCAQPIVRKMGYESVLRFSPAFYNSLAEVGTIREALSGVLSFFGRRSIW